jgi:hypothetical protein
MALIDVADKNQIKIVQNRIKKDCIEFNSLSVGNKVKASNQLYMENRILKELGNAAVETIEKMDEEIEVSLELLPIKSRPRYGKEYNALLRWRQVVRSASLASTSSSVPLFSVGTRYLEKKIRNIWSFNSCKKLYI